MRREQGNERCRLFGLSCAASGLDRAAGFAEVFRVTKAFVEFGVEAGLDPDRSHDIAHYNVESVVHRDCTGEGMEGLTLGRAGRVTRIRTLPLDRADIHNRAAMEGQSGHDVTDRRKGTVRLSFSVALQSDSEASSTVPSRMRPA